MKTKVLLLLVLLLGSVVLIVQAGANNFLDKLWSPAPKRGATGGKGSPIDRNKPTVIMAPTSAKLTGDTMMVTLCAVDFEQHTKAPNETPMFRTLSDHCIGPKNTVTMSVDDLSKQLDEQTVAPLKGFVLHASRCGSTLVANVLARDPAHVVYSEPSLPISIYKSCQRSSKCTDEKRNYYVRTIIRAMGATSHYSSVFIKFQSSSALSIQPILDSLPDTPWIYLFREPRQILASYTAKTSGMTVCIRNSRGHASEVTKLLDQGDPSHEGTWNDEAMCVGHFTVLMGNALHALKTNPGRGLALDYADWADPSLAHHQLLLKALETEFHYTPTAAVLRDIESELSMYSKASSPRKRGEFEGDIEKKEKAVSKRVVELCDSYTLDIYQELQQLSFTL